MDSVVPIPAVVPIHSKPRALLQIGISKNTATDFIFSEVRRSCNQKADVVLDTLCPYRITRENLHKVSELRLTPREFYTMIDLELQQITAEANRRYSRLAIFLGQCPYISYRAFLTFHFGYFVVRIGQFICWGTNIYNGNSHLALMFLHMLTSPLTFLGALFMAIVGSILDFFTGYYCRKTELPAERQWYEAFMRAHADLDTFIIDDYIRAELDGVATRFVTEFPHLSIILWSGVELIELGGSGVPCTEDKFILCVDKLIDGGNSTDGLHTTNIGSSNLP